MNFDELKAAALAYVPPQAVVELTEEGKAELAAESEDLKQLLHEYLDVDWEPIIVDRAVYVDVDPFKFFIDDEMGCLRIGTKDFNDGLYCRSVTGWADVKIYISQYEEDRENKRTAKHNSQFNKAGGLTVREYVAAQIMAQSVGVVMATDQRVFMIRGVNLTTALETSAVSSVLAADMLIKALKAVPISTE